MARFERLPQWRRKRRKFVVERNMGHYRKLMKMQRRALRTLLKQVRLDAKLDQRQAGELLGQDQTFISKIERGERQVEFVEVAHFAHIYRKPLSFFTTSIESFVKT
jgi:hypothetical protein